MIIRQGSPDDCVKIFELETRAFPSTPWSFDMVNEELKLKFDRKTWVVEKDDFILGYCMVRYGPGEAHLINMAVDSRFQKRGVGSTLLQNFLKDISPKTSVFLEVKQSNFPAINLYKKHDFIEVGLRKKYYSDGENAIVMLWIKD